MRFLLNISVLFSAVLLLCVQFEQVANAQLVPAQPVQQEEKRERTTPDYWKNTLDAASQVLEEGGVNEQRLDTIIETTNVISTDASAEVRELEPRLAEINQQLSELGPEPAEGEPEESSEAKERRAALNQQFAEIDAELKTARLAVVRAQQVQRSVIQTRQSKFLSSISVRSEGLFTATFWKSFAASLSGYVRGVEILFKDGYSIALRELGDHPFKLFVVPFIFLAITLALVRGRRFLSSRIILDAQETQGAVYKSRFIEFCREGILPSLFLFLAYQLFWHAFLLTPRMGQVWAGFSVIIGLYIMAITLVRIILLPQEGRDRILRVNDAPARKIVQTLTYGLAIASIFSALNALAIIVYARLSVSIVFSLCFALTISATFIRVLWILYKDRHRTETLSSIVEYSGTWRLVRFLVQAIAIAILIAAILGYIAFAEFLGQQLVFGLVVIGSVWLILRFVHNVSAPHLTQPVEASVQGSTDQTGQRQANQFVILATGLLTLALYVTAAVLLLLPWGYRTSDFYQIFESVFFGFEIGGLRISMSTVLLVVGLFALGYTATVSLRNWLNTKLLPTTSLDVGISNSISTVFGYIGFILAAILAISVAGFDLSNLAIVAGALSVGVGFGLQSIVNNFVSGLILLAERPIKAGDWIVTSGGEGIVTKISVRSTEIETFDRATVIIPNSTLITDNVTNWTHTNKTGRLIVSVGVGYDSDVDLVREILFDCAREHRLILGRPEPQVVFMDFGASSLDFQLRCFLADVNYVLTVGSELRFEILRRFREAGVEIPFPQQDLNIRGHFPGVDEQAK